MDLPAKTDCDIMGALYGDILMMQAILVDDTYINLKGVTWVLCTNDVGVLDDIVYIKKGV